MNGCSCNINTESCITSKEKKIKSLIFLLLLLSTGIALYIFLKDITDLFVFNLMGLDPLKRLTMVLHFFIYEVPKVLLLLTVIVFAVGIIRSYFSPEKTRKALEGKPLFIGNVMAASLGIVTPFCSCSAIPLFIGFMESGIPVGVTFSFLISAPMVNEVALVLLFGLFGWKTALLYLSTGLIIAIDREGPARRAHGPARAARTGPQPGGRRLALGPGPGARPATALVRGHGHPPRQPALRRRDGAGHPGLSRPAAGEAQELVGLGRLAVVHHPLGLSEAAGQLALARHLHGAARQELAPQGVGHGLGEVLVVGRVHARQPLHLEQHLVLAALAEQVDAELAAQFLEVAQHRADLAGIDVHPPEDDRSGPGPLGHAPRADGRPARGSVRRAPGSRRGRGRCGPGRRRGPGPLAAEASLGAPGGCRSGAGCARRGRPRGRVPVRPCVPGGSIE